MKRTVGAALAVIGLGIACGLDDVPVSTGGGFGTATSTKPREQPPDDAPPSLGEAPPGFPGSGLCADGGTCPAGLCCGTTCCAFSQICCAGRCLTPSVTQPTCELFLPPLP